MYVFVHVVLFLCPVVENEGYSGSPTDAAGSVLSHHISRMGKEKLHTGTAFQEAGRAGWVSGMSKLTAWPSWQVPFCCVILPELQGTLAALSLFLALAGKYLFYLFFLCVTVFGLRVCVYTMCVHMPSTEFGRGHWTSCSYGGSEPPCGCWEPSPGPLVSSVPSALSCSLEHLCSTECRFPRL